MDGCLDDAQILDYALDGLDVDARAIAERHLDLCANCREQVRQAMLLQDAFADLAAGLPEPPGLAEAILERRRRDR